MTLFWGHLCDEEVVAHSGPIRSFKDIREKRDKFDFDFFDKITFCKFMVNILLLLKPKILLA